MNEWLEQHRILVLTLTGLLIAAGLGLVAARWQAPAPIVIQPPVPTPTPGPIRVYVSGAVSNMDVYSLPAGSILEDAIQAAGGATEDADLVHLNLAQPLHDGDQVYVPRIGEAPTSAPVGSDPQSPTPGIVNINRATQAELETLPGIGPALAAAIIAYREQNGPFQQIEDIQNVPGIGPAIFENIKTLITI